MFGHVKGAFTGADHGALGCFRAADRGTIFLDEIGELDRDLQAKLLRVLQERVVTPLGSHATVPVDVRVIAATNCELKHMVAIGRFREDLYYRLNVVTIKTIPLRDRPEDIVPLARYFLRKMAGRLGVPVRELSCRCSGCMLRHDWPGNVRELENFVEQAVVLSGEKAIRPDTVSDDAGRTCICPIAASLGCQQGEACASKSEEAVASAAPSVAADIPMAGPGRRWTKSSASISSGRSSRPATTIAAQPTCWAFTANSCCARSGNTDWTVPPADLGGRRRPR